MMIRYDSRITFKDLNNLTTLNSLTSQDKEHIWSPQIAFVNALGPFQTGIDDTMSAFLVREGEPLKEDLTQSTEGDKRG